MRKCQIENIEGIMKLENHHLATVVVIIDLTMNIKTSR